MKLFLCCLLLKPKEASAPALMRLCWRRSAICCQEIKQLCSLKQWGHITSLRAFHLSPHGNEIFLQKFAQPYNIFSSWTNHDPLLGLEPFRIGLQREWVSAPTCAFSRKQWVSTCVCILSCASSEWAYACMLHLHEQWVGVSATCTKSSPLLSRHSTKPKSLEMSALNHL